MKEEFNKKNPVAWIYQLVRVGKIFTIRGVLRFLYTKWKYMMQTALAGFIMM